MRLEAGDDDRSRRRPCKRRGCSPCADHPACPGECESRLLLVRTGSQDCVRTTKRDTVSDAAGGCLRAIGGVRARGIYVRDHVVRDAADVRRAHFAPALAVLLTDPTGRARAYWRARRAVRGVCAFDTRTCRTMDLARTLAAPRTFAVRGARHLAQSATRTVRRVAAALAAEYPIQPEARALRGCVAANRGVVLRAADHRETNDQNSNSNVHGRAIGPPPLRLSS